MSDPPGATEWEEVRGDGPIVAVAVHDGHEIRPSLRPHLALDAPARRREEDPTTGLWAALAPTRLVANRSRFEVDLNRPPERAVYRTPAEAWGLTVWRGELPAAELEASRRIHARFYARLAEVLDDTLRREGGFVLLDIHSYNHRRAGPDLPAADPEGNPAVDIGTGSVDRALWGGLVDRFIADLRGQPAVPALDVRENVRFRGGHVPGWTNGRYRERGVALAIEFKKTFLDEWSGAPDCTWDRAAHAALGRALAATFPGLAGEIAARRGRGRAS